MKWSHNDTDTDTDTDTDALPLTLMMSFAVVSALPVAAVGAKYQAGGVGFSGSLIP